MNKENNSNETKENFSNQMGHVEFVFLGGFKVSYSKIGKITNKVVEEYKRYMREDDLCVDRDPNEAIKINTFYTSTLSSN